MAVHCVTPARCFGRFFAPPARRRPPLRMTRLEHFVAKGHAPASFRRKTAPVDNTLRLGIRFARARGVASPRRALL